MSGCYGDLSDNEGLGRREIAVQIPEGSDAECSVITSNAITRDSACFRTLAPKTQSRSLSDDAEAAEYSNAVRRVARVPLSGVELECWRVNFGKSWLWKHGVFFFSTILTRNGSGGDTGLEEEKN